MRTFFRNEYVGDMMKLLDIYKKLRTEIADIEAVMEEAVRSEHGLLTEASLHLLKAGGKRIRPIFVLLSGSFGSGEREHLIQIAASLELIHMASLVHDDVIDDAATRRGQPTVKAKWDNRVAMYTGDYIFAKALNLAAEVPNPRIHQILSRALVQMSIGEIEQIRLFFEPRQTIRDYLLRIRRKTALLIAVSCQLGAMAAGADQRASNTLYRYGYNVGMAFQITDDLLDINGTEKQLGKPPGSDVRQGNITLPVILALQEDSLRHELLQELKKIQHSEGRQDTSRFIDMIRASKGLQKAESMAKQYIDKALQAIRSLQKTQASQDLMAIASFIVNRNF